MSFVHLPTPVMHEYGEPRLTSGQQAGQQIHVSGVFIILIELALTFENLLPILVCVLWLPSQTIGDRQICVFSVLCILSALVPTPLGLVSYFSGGWYGGNPTCVTYQVTSLWCSLSSLAMLSYMSITCNFSVCHLLRARYPREGCVLSDTAPRLTSSALLFPTRRKTVSKLREYINLDTSYSAQSLVALGDVERSDSLVLPVKRENDFIKPTSMSIKNGQTTYLDDQSKTLEELSESLSCCASSESAFDDKQSSGNGNKQLKSDNELYSSVNLHSPKEKSILYLDMYRKSRKMKKWAKKGYQCSSLDQLVKEPLCASHPANDFMTLTLVVMFSTTLTVALLPTLGLGPSTVQNNTSCDPWLAHKPREVKEEIFPSAYLIFVSLCLIAGGCSGIHACRKARRYLRNSKTRGYTVYYENNRTKEHWELAVLSNVKRHYRLNCVALAGQLTWIPLLIILTQQKCGVGVSEAVLMYSAVVTSLPGLLNPLLYGLVLSHYRSGYKAILGKRCCQEGGAKTRGRNKIDNGKDQYMYMSRTDHHSYDDDLQNEVTSRTDQLTVEAADRYSDNTEDSRFGDDSSNPEEEKEEKPSSNFSVLTETTPLQVANGGGHFPSRGTFDSAAVAAVPCGDVARVVADEPSSNNNFYRTLNGCGDGRRIETGL